jgi:hypothetical protein
MVPQILTLRKEAKDLMYISWRPACNYLRSIDPLIGDFGVYQEYPGPGNVGAA